MPGRQGGDGEMLEHCGGDGEMPEHHGGDGDRALPGCCNGEEDGDVLGC